MVCCFLLRPSLPAPAVCWAGPAAHGLFGARARSVQPWGHQSVNRRPLHAGVAKEPAPSAATTRGGVYIPPGSMPVSTGMGTATTVTPMRMGAPVVSDVISDTRVSAV